jgi:hypothetical protein
MLQVTSASGATTSTQNVPVHLNVKWFYTSGCDEFDNFNTSQNGNVLIVKAIGHTNNTICTQETGLKTAIYIFNSTSTGNYEIRFTNKDNTYISHFVTVN